MSRARYPSTSRPGIWAARTSCDANSSKPGFSHPAIRRTERQADALLRQRRAAYFPVLFAQGSYTLSDTIWFPTAVNRGVLTFGLEGNRTAAITFKEGELVRAKHGNLVDKEAFWEVLREKKGRFKFTPGLPPEEESKSEIGQFMWLLMEGLSRMDEETYQQSEKRRYSE